LTKQFFYLQFLLIKLHQTIKKKTKKQKKQKTNFKTQNQIFKKKLIYIIKKRKSVELKKNK